MGRAHIGESSGKLSPMRGTPSHKQAKRSPLPEGEGLEETTCNELITAPIPCLLALLGQEEAENSGVELILGRRGRCRKVF